jgi:ribosome biogenesis GTPase
VAESLERWGLGEAQRARYGVDEARLGRVTAEFRGGYLVMTVHGELKAQSSGRLRRDIKRAGADKPAVGDWVELDARPAEGTALLSGVLPRVTVVRRRAAGRDAVAQVVCANVDLVLIVSALTEELNLRRLERYLAVVRESGVPAAIALTKADLSPEAEARAAEVRALAGPDVPVDVLSNVSGEGVAALDRHFAGGATVALVGSSGVGKSTLINRWLAGTVLPTAEVDREGQGRHTTTHRELFLRPAGGLVMDTPGMRELGVWGEGGGLDDAFTDVAEVAERCRFRDCRHGGEPGCAVAEALAQGTVSAARVAAWRKLAGELKETGKAAEVQRRKEARVLNRVAPAKRGKPTE